MITSLKGIVRTLSTGNPPRISLIVGGIGYEVHLPIFVYEAVVNSGISIGDEAEYEIYYHVSERQPRPILVGFQNAPQKAFFERLITVEGIGPLRAITALDVSPAVLIRAIEAGDANTIAQMPGIGKRGAQKVIATLQGKMDIEFADGSTMGSVVTPILNTQNEAIQALVALQFRTSEARKLVDEVTRTNPEATSSVEAILKEVFRLRQKTERNPK